MYLIAPSVTWLAGYAPWVTRKSWRHFSTQPWQPGMCTFAIRDSKSLSESKQQKKAHPVDKRSEGTSYVKNNMFSFHFSPKNQNILLAYNTAPHVAPGVLEASCHHLCPIFILLAYVWGEGPLRFLLGSASGSIIAMDPRFLIQGRQVAASQNGLHGVRLQEWHFQHALKNQQPGRTKAQTDSVPLRRVPAPRFKKERKKSIFLSMELS